VKGHDTIVAGLRPTQLRCEYLTNPLGIDVIRPRLSWVLEATGRGRRQSAYHILVASSEQGLRAAWGDLWDSGKVVAAASNQIVYGGRTMRSGQRCWWSVRVWDEADAPSTDSDPAWWEMGLLHPDNWQGAWIGLDAASVTTSDLGRAADQVELSRRPEPCPFLRTTFMVARPVRRARLYVTARGLYEMRLNGRRVGDAVLTPGWTGYNTRIQYQTYDVGDVLRVGDNAIGAILGAGWFSGCVGFGTHNHRYGSAPQLLAQLCIDYADGTADTVVTDRSWRAAVGPILNSDLLMGETYDARVALRGWDDPDYDDADWHLVALTERNTDMARLVADHSEPVRVIEEVAPCGITQRDGDTQIVDLGQNIVGWARLRVSGQAGMRVRCTFRRDAHPRRRALHG